MIILFNLLPASFLSTYAVVIAVCLYYSSPIKQAELIVTALTNKRLLLITFDQFSNPNTLVSYLLPEVRFTRKTDTPLFVTIQLQVPEGERNLSLLKALGGGKLAAQIISSLEAPPLSA